MKISIITVSFNRGKTIRDTIESVLAQSYQDYEYLIIDGGSKDDTINIVKEYYPRFDGRMKYVSEPDRGLYDAINKGIHMATGDIVGIINSDDFYHRNDIFKTIASAFETDSSIQAVYGDVRFVNPDNLEKTVRYYSSAGFKPSKFRWGWMPAHPSFFTYKDNFDKYGYYKIDYQIGADFELLLRFLYIHHLPVKYIPEDFLTMRMGGRSTNGFKSNILLNRENVRSCRDNGIYTNMPMLFLRYFVKIFEFVKTRN